MEQEWIRGKDIPIIYQIGKTAAYNLLLQYRAESSDWIKDGRILIVKKREFEEWWKNRRNRQSEPR